MTRSSVDHNGGRPVHLLELELARTRAALLLAHADIRNLHKLNSHLSEELRGLRRQYYELLDRIENGEDENTEALRLRL